MCGFESLFISVSPASPASPLSIFLAFSPRTIHNGTTTTLARHHVLDRVLPNSTQTDSPREWLGAAGNWTPQIHHGVAALHAYLRP